MEHERGHHPLRLTASRTHIQLQPNAPDRSRSGAFLLLDRAERKIGLAWQKNSGFSTFELGSWEMPRKGCFLQESEDNRDRNRRKHVFIFGIWLIKGVLTFYGWLLGEEMRNLSPFFFWFSGLAEKRDRARRRSLFAPSSEKTLSSPEQGRLGGWLDRRRNRGGWRGCWSGGRLSFGNTGHGGFS